MSKSEYNILYFLPLALWLVCPTLPLFEYQVLTVKIVQPKLSDFKETETMSALFISELLSLLTYIETFRQLQKFLL